MRISAVVEALASDLTVLGNLGDEATADAVGRLATAMEGPMTARLLEILGQMAAEVDASVPGLRVEVRLVAGDARLMLVDDGHGAEAAEAGPGSDSDARITLRLPSRLKADIEAASSQEGVSVNTYIVRALGRQARPDRGPRVGRRLSGHGKS